MNTREIVLKNDEPFLPLRVFNTGGLNVSYEAGCLRYIKYGGWEVVRMIFPTLRDEIWKTIPYSISDEVIDERDNGFTISYRAHFDSDPILYDAEFTITGSGDGTIHFEMKGKAGNTFLSKRTGLCVHHPIDSCAGKSVEIIKPAGVTERSEFPVYIAPHNPFTDIEGMRWKLSNDLNAELLFEGELFETEDQRNWSDDSYKTYSGPQYKVSMIHMKKGDTMYQKVTLKISGQQKLPLPEIQLKNTRGDMPAIGYRYLHGAKMSFDPLYEKLKSIPHDHLSVEILLTDTLRDSLLNDAALLAERAGMKLRLSIFFHSGSADEINWVKDALKKYKNQAASVLILTEKNDIPAIDFFTKTYQVLKNDYPGIPVGYGTSSWFASLNRNYPVDIACDFVSFVLSPQVHQTDHRSILENLLSQYSILETIRKNIGNVPVHISIIFSRVEDTRLHSAFAAWWTLNTIADLAGAEVLSLYDLSGDRGVLGKTTDRQSSLYQMLETVHQHKPVRIISERNINTQDPMAEVRSSGIFLENESGERIYYMMTDI